MIFYRPTVASISLDAVRQNVRAIQARVGEGCLVMAVVKANAYGHGMIEVAEAALDAGAQWLGIATVDEAIALRKTGIDTPVLILGPTFPADAETLVANDISVAAGSLEVARALGRAARKLKKRALIHVKVDTGMGRFGFWWKNLIPLLANLKRVRGIRLEGCFTHFATSDVRDPAYTRLQHNRFKRLLTAARRENIRFDIIHAANSGAILQHPDTFYNMVRAGVMMYGMLPDPQTMPTVPLLPVMTLTTKIVEIRTQPKGRSLSYGCTYKTLHKSRIAILPIGYGDGYSRKLSNRGEVIIRGRRAPIVGRVCMDQTLVDITNIPAARIGDDVLLWGTWGKDTLKVEEVAKWIGTITYEVTCALGCRVPRIYI